MRLGSVRRRWAMVWVVVLLALAVVVGWHRSRPWRHLQSAALALERAELAERLARTRTTLDSARLESLELALEAARTGLEDRQPEIEQLERERRALVKRERRAARRSATRESQALRELIADHDLRLEALNAAYEVARQELADARRPVDELEERQAATAPSRWLKLLPAKARPWFDRRLHIRQVETAKLYNSVPPTTVLADRCQTCHLGAADPYAEGRPAPFATHPKLDLYLGEDSPHVLPEVGCTVCHGGVGAATDFSRAGHSPGNDPERAARWRRQWDWRPVAGASIIRVGESVQAGCVGCHEAEGEVPGAGAWQRGRQIATSLGCEACHGAERRMPMPTRLGPPLDRLSSKTTVEWVDRWLATPPSERPGTAMPHFFAAEPESGRERSVERRALAVYLVESSLGGNLPSPPAGDAAAGARLFDTVGCKACHGPAQFGRRFSAPAWPLAPPLLADGPQASAGKLAAGWLYQWLLDPVELDPDSRMPNLRLSSQEAADLTTFLLTEDAAGSSRGGPALPPIDTEMRDQLVRAQLEHQLGIEAGQARFEQLSEHERTLLLGRRAAAEYGCASCHLVPGVEAPAPLPPLAETVAKMAPDTDGTARLRAALVTHGHLPMAGALAVAEPELDDLVVYLTGLAVARASTIAPSRAVVATQRVQDLAVGRQWIEALGCRACHELEGRGGSGEDLLRLDIAGHRARSHWLFEYLEDPSAVTLRPSLELRMPTYDLDDVARDSLVAYFAALADRPVLESAPPPATRQELAVGAAVYRVLQCDGCHGGSGEAPQYLLARDRLRPQWVEQLILAPEEWLPGSGMPSAFAGLEGGGYDATFLETMLGAPLFYDTRLRLARAFEDPAELEAHLRDADRVARSLTAHLRQLEP